jgi:hydroxyacylglutathione hydrolase
VPLVRLEEKEHAGLGLDGVAPDLDRGRALDDGEEGVLLDLVVTEFLARLEPDQDCPSLLVRMQHDGGSAALGRRDHAEVPEAHGPDGNPDGWGKRPPLHSVAMLAVDRFVTGPAQENCYLVRRERGALEAVVIDPGDGATQLRLELARAGARCAAILVTHTHWDHIGAVAELADGTGAPVYAPATEREVLERPDDFYASRGVHVQPHTPEHTLSGGETVTLAGIEFEVAAVPGHSPGHLAFHADGCLFSGDVLFAGGVGRTDLPFGDRDELLASIRALTERFPTDTIVYPGHGPETTLGAELAHNPFLMELRAS